MAKRRRVDEALAERVAQNLFNALPIFRKRLVHMDVIQRQYHIPLSHVQVLAMLNDNGSMSVSEISRRLGIAKPNITPLVDRLIQGGLAVRCRDESDRRVVNISICEEGVEKLTAIRQTMVEEVTDWASAFTAAELRELNESLASVTRILGNVATRE